MSYRQTSGPGWLLFGGATTILLVLLQLVLVKPATVAAPPQRAVAQVETANATLKFWRKLCSISICWWR